jgi:excisionase family DNA binding protein
MQTTEPDDLLTPSEVARLFGVGPAAVVRWANKGIITAIWTPGGQRRFRRADVDALLDEQAS